MEDCHGRYVTFPATFFAPSMALLTLTFRCFISFFLFRFPARSGPGFQISDFESNRIIGQLQFEGAQTVMNGPLTAVHGTVKSVHTYVTM